MDKLTVYTSILFGCTTLLTVLLFGKATDKPARTIMILVTWMVLQAVLGLVDFYTVTNSIPPRFLLMVLPPVIGIILLFATASGRRYLDGLNIKTLTLLHTVRIPVEITLYLLLLIKWVPQLMTFEGRNFDILAGITAPLIFYIVFVKKRGNKILLLVWNSCCLLLLLNIVVSAILAAPSPLQQWAFEQPNIAVLHFPFNWLPSVVVPIVLLSHLAAMRSIRKAKHPDEPAQ